MYSCPYNEQVDMKFELHNYSKKIKFPSNE